MTVVGTYKLQKTVNSLPKLTWPKKPFFQQCMYVYIHIYIYVYIYLPEVAVPGQYQILDQITFQVVSGYNFLKNTTHLRLSTSFFSKVTWLSF